MRLKNCKKNSYHMARSYQTLIIEFYKKKMGNKEGFKIQCWPHCNCAGVFFTLNHMCSTKLLYKHLSGLENSFSLPLAFRMTKLVIFVCLMLLSLARAQDQGKYS